MIAPALPNAAGTGCTLQGTDTGCYVWTNNIPANGFFRIRVVLTDKNGMIVRMPSNFVNGGKVNTIAGNTDPDLGASAQTAIFYNYGKQRDYLSDPGSFVVLNDGTIYFRDASRGLLTVSPYDGIQKLLIPTTGASVDGPVASAQLHSPGKIALDYNNGLLIFDYDRIRRLDLSTMTISTFIGTGNQYADGVPPLSVQISPRLANDFNYSDYDGFEMPLIPLPNGDLIFQSESNKFLSVSNFPPGSLMRFRRYIAAQGQVFASPLRGPAIIPIPRKIFKRAPLS